ncbi:PD-(D/E)XK nuclease family protein [Variovorax sp. YR752]|uniref:PD-(D/E)XK nuclease family protein n=1 Tax=Variovorax sp. YR752 TaxID=1884383 RepID=UPI003137B242
MPLRDVVLLLPFTQLLPLARLAFARAGGWQPRIETTQTLAVSLGPAPVVQAQQLSFDTAADRLGAARLLRTQANGAAWARDDPRRFDRTVAAVVQTAQALARAAFALAPAQRPAHWAAARALLSPMGGPGAQQRWLARVALEWAAQCDAPQTDRLFEMHPAAWVVLQAGGADALVESLVNAAGDVPALIVDADAAALRVAAVAAAPALVRCDGFEDEAQRTVATVLQHLGRNEWPVALIGLDRQLVRRVRALLEHAQVPLADENGWTLSTTRAGAQVMALLRAAAPRAGSDALFDWLKTLPPWPGLDPTGAVLRELERRCRRLAVARIDRIAVLPLDGEPAALRDAVMAGLARLRAPRLGVNEWLDRLREVLQVSGAWDALAADRAGQAVLQALRWLPGRTAGAVWQDVTRQSVLRFDDFVSWVDAVLEGETFMPQGPAAEQARVVVTPLARAMLRPFAAVVCPGADERHLGAAPASHPLLSDAELAALGLPNRADRLQRESLALVQVLTQPRVSFLRRHVDAGGEPLADSPLLQRLALDLADRGRALASPPDPREARASRAQPVARPMPVAAVHLPTRLSASAVEALRDCPYRFFARHVLGLREDDELEAELEKRDYGTWLHAVLMRFHMQREAPGSIADESARLQAVASELRQEMALPDDQFLPFAASFARLVPRYLDWLHRRDAAGAQWLAGERDCSIQPEALAGIELQGRIDRIDRVGHGSALQLIDYKTSAADTLKERVRQPFEDTQLAFYAALLAPEADAPLQASYVLLDSGDGIGELEHPNVKDSAVVLVRELGAEMARLRAGAPLPALGEGSTCDYCEARGLCRRDHWPDGAPA